MLDEDWCMGHKYYPKDSLWYTSITRVCIQPLLFGRSHRASRAHRRSRLSGRFRDRNNCIMCHDPALVKHADHVCYAQAKAYKTWIQTAFPHSYSQP